MFKKLALASMIAGASLALPLTSSEARADAYITNGVVENPKSPYLRGFAELGFGALFGTVAAAPPLLAGVFTNPFKIKNYLSASAVLYPAGIASGVILGGYLTDSYSNYWAPFVGAYAGALVADITAYFLADDYPNLSAWLVLLLPIVTSTIAAEVSHTHHKRDEHYPILLTFPF